MPSIQVPPQSIRQMLPGVTQTTPDPAHLIKAVDKAGEQVAQIRSGLYLIQHVQQVIPAPPPKQSYATSDHQLLLQGALEQLLVRLPASLQPAWLKAGHWIRLTVSGNGQIRLVPATPDEDVQAARHIQSRQLNSALRRWLPLELRVSEALPRLLAPAPTGQSTASASTASAAANRVPEVDVARLRLRQALPDATRLMTPDGLRQTIENSGLFSEAQLKSFVTGPQHDFKRLLLDVLVSTARALKLPATALETLFRQDFPQGADTLITTLMQSLTDKKTGPVRQQALDTGQWLHVLARLIARVHVQQLSSLATGTSQTDPGMPQVLWVAELPWIWQGKAGAIELKVARREVHKGPSGRPAIQWQVTLGFPWADSGTLHARILYCETQVSAHFWAPDSALCTKVERARAHLENGLRKWGLSVGEISAQVGEPAETGQAVSRHFIDTRV